MKLSTTPRLVIVLCLILAFVAFSLAQDATTPTVTSTPKPGTVPATEGTTTTTTSTSTNSTQATANEKESEEEIDATVADIIKEYSEMKNKKDFFVRQLSFEKKEDVQTLATFLASDKLEASRVVFSSFHDLSDKDLSTLFSQGIGKAHNLQVFGLAKIALGKESCAALASVLATHKSLGKLHLYRNKLTPECIKELVEHGLRKNKNVYKLVSIENNWGDQGISVLADYVTSSDSGLKELVLRDAKITAGASKALARLLGENSSLHKVDLSENPKIGNAGLVDVVAGLKRSRHLTHFEMNYGELDRKSVPLFGELLRENRKLERLDLSENEFGDDGAELFATILADTTKPVSLAKLDLSSCEIEDKGALALANAVQANPKSVQLLYLYRNEISNTTVQQQLVKLADVIKSDYTNETMPDASEDEAENLGEGLIDAEDDAAEDEESEDEDETEAGKVQAKRVPSADEKKGTNNASEDEPDEDEASNDGESFEESEDEDGTDIPEAELAKHQFLQQAAKTTTPRDEL